MLPLLQITKEGKERDESDAQFMKSWFIEDTDSSSDRVIVRVRDALKRTVVGDYTQTITQVKTN